MKPQTVVVTGATGNVGHHVVAGLRDAGVTVRALSRDPSSSRLPAGVATLGGDLTEPGSLRHASAGADAAFLLWPFPAAQGAEAAVGALAGATYVLTGPEAVTQADQARIIGEVTGLPVRWEEDSPESVRAQLTAMTGDHAFADHALAYWASLITQPEPVTHAVEEITGAPARTFRDWVRDHAGEFRPSPPAG